jgi:hypothetical protein
MENNDPAFDNPAPGNLQDNPTLHNPTPNNPTPNPISLIPAVRGPILLIAIGILFALDYSAGIRFWKTWPVLLIVVGVLHLMERKAGSPT